MDVGSVAARFIGEDCSLVKTVWIARIDSCNAGRGAQRASGGAVGQRRSSTLTTLISAKRPVHRSLDALEGMVWSRAVVQFGNFSARSIAWKRGSLRRVQERFGLEVRKSRIALLERLLEQPKRSLLVPPLRQIARRERAPPLPRSDIHRHGLSLRFDSVTPHITAVPPELLSRSVAGREPSGVLCEAQ
jgi:hypothetical protein